MPTDNKNPIAHLATEKWLMSRDRVLATIARGATAPASLADPDDSDPADSQLDGYQVVNGVAHVPVVGVLTKYPSWLDEYLGFVPAITIQNAIQSAMDDPTVRSIVLIIDSPGGLVAGTNELADYIFKQGGRKPFHAVISDQAASGGYFIASQCATISCNAGGTAGCIGVYCVLVDDSKFWQDMGISLELVSSGGVKGLGADGKITPEYRADVQREINDIYNIFIQAVSRGRGLTTEQATKLGDGRSWIASQAQSLGLIDNIASVGDAIAAITKETQMITAEQARAWLAENPNDSAVNALQTKSFEEGKTAGMSDGRKAGFSAAVGILTVFGLADHAATASIKAGDDEATAKRIADAQAAAKAEAVKAAQVEAEKSTALAKENERLKAELGTQGAVNLSGSTVAANNQLQNVVDGSDPENTAKAEWAKMSADQKSAWLDEKTYIGYRKAELKGQVKTGRVNQ